MIVNLKRVVIIDNMTLARPISACSVVHSVTVHY